MNHDHDSRNFLVSSFKKTQIYNLYNEIHEYIDTSKYIYINV